MTEVKIWQIKFSLSDRHEITAQVDDWLTAGRKGIHLTGVNPEQVVRAQHDESLRRAINDSDIVNVDGILTAFGLRLEGYRYSQRVATPDVMEDFLKLADRKKQKVFLFGAEPEVLEQAVKNISEKYPNLFIVGQEDGYRYDEAEVIRKIASAEPDYLFIALPSPLKEKFIMDNKHLLNTGVLYGIGGAFDVLGGKYHRAPACWRKLNLEWLWRVLQNPRRNGMRVLKFYPRFFMLMFKWRLARGKRAQSDN